MNKLPTETRAQILHLLCDLGERERHCEVILLAGEACCPIGLFVRLPVACSEDLWEIEPLLILRGNIRRSRCGGEEEIARCGHVPAAFRGRADGRLLGQVLELRRESPSQG